MTHIVPKWLGERNPRDPRLTEVLRRVEANLDTKPKDEYAPKPREEEPRVLTVEEKIAKLEDMTRVLADLTAEKTALAKDIDADFIRLNEMRARLSGQEPAKTTEETAQ